MMERNADKTTSVICIVVSIALSENIILAIIIRPNPNMTANPARCKSTKEEYRNTPEYV